MELKPSKKTRLYTAGYTVWCSSSTVFGSIREAPLPLVQRQSPLNLNSTIRQKYMFISQVHGNVLYRLGTIIYFPLMVLPFPVRIPVFYTSSNGEFESQLSLPGSCRTCRSETAAVLLTKELHPSSLANFLTCLLSPQ